MRATASSIDVVTGTRVGNFFMTRADCRLAGNQQLGKKPGAPPWSQHIALYFTLFPDERTCAIWVAVVDRCRRKGQRIQTADAWIASAALQFGCPLVTTDFGDYGAVEDLELVPIR